MKNKTIKSYLFAFVLISFFSCSCMKDLNIEHDEARNVVIKNIDFTNLKKGEYKGYYAGGMHGWRENECKVTVDSINIVTSRVIKIELLSSVSDYTREFLDTLYNRVLSAQSLHVDAYSGATLDSKACLKSIEDALIKAEK